MYPGATSASTASIFAPFQDGGRYMTPLPNKILQVEAFDKYTFITIHIELGQKFL